MAQTHYKTLLRKVLLGCISEADPILAMLRWVTDQMMQIESEAKVGAEKGAHCGERKTYFSGTRVRRMDTRLGTIYLLVPKAAQGWLCALLHLRETAIRTSLDRRRPRGLHQRRQHPENRTLG